MQRQRVQAETLTVGQLAKRWSVSTDRVHSRIRAGLLTGAFRIPSVGRYGATTKIPIVAVLLVEQDWCIVPAELTSPKRKPPRSRGGSLPVLRHFPELQVSVESSAESPAVASHSGARNDAESALLCAP